MDQITRPSNILKPDPAGAQIQPLFSHLNKRKKESLTLYQATSIGKFWYHHCMPLALRVQTYKQEKGN